jgi:hypothetical protein
MVRNRPWPRKNAPGFVVVAAILAGADRISLAGKVIPYLAVAWMILAILWMFKWMFKVILRLARD